MTDYHDMVTIDTPKSERRKFRIGDIWINAAQCKKCSEKIRSRNRHDMKWCSCGAVAVDGGSWYSRRAFKDRDDYEDEIVMFSDVECADEVGAALGNKIR